MYKSILLSTGLQCMIFEVYGVYHRKNSLSLHNLKPNITYVCTCDRAHNSFCWFAWGHSLRPAFQSIYSQLL